MVSRQRNISLEPQEAQDLTELDSKVCLWPVVTLGLKNANKQIKKKSQWKPQKARSEFKVQLISYSLQKQQFKFLTAHIRTKFKSPDSLLELL